MTEKLAKQYLPRDVEQKWYDFWLEHDLFRADEASDKPPFCIVIPPPNVTGKLHMGHALFVTIQDLLTRYKRMQGFEALWLPGTDHAGIATQVMVERQLAREGTDRHALGREKFLERVWQWKEEKGGLIQKQMQIMGASCDWSRERFTMDEGLSLAVREAFVRLYEEQLLYRGARLVNWDPEAQTVLSDLEVEQDTEQGSLWHIAYPLADDPSRRIVVATTRPETLLGDTAVAVHPDDERYKDVIGKLVLLPLTGRTIPIVADPLVADPEFGSGAVKITPAHDFNDFEAGVRNNLPRIQVIGLDARMTDAVPEKYRGLTREACREVVVADLQAQGFLEKVEPHTFMPARSQRSGVIVEPMLLPQWWVKAGELAGPAIEAVRSGRTLMLPRMWEKTWYNWLENIRDWCVSRQLWWGHQVPAWYRRDDAHLVFDESGALVSIGADAVPYVARTLEEAAQAAGCTPADLVQDPDVLDTWFSSGLWPFSTLGWPQQTEALAKFYPTTVMETGFDIIFFWVARMMMFGLHFMGEVPFEQVYFHALIRDKYGDKMSKTKGNVVDPLHVVFGVTPDALEEDERKSCAQLFEDYPEGIDAMGADALRFTLSIYAAQGRDIRLDLKRVEGYRGFFNKLWQASRFVLMNLERLSAEDAARVQATGSSPQAALPFAPEDLSLADAWILDRLQATVDKVTTALDGAAGRPETGFVFNKAAEGVYDFVWNEFCDWYIELSKPSLYADDPSEAAARLVTCQVLVHVLETVLRLLHPFAPYVSEEIWQALPRAAGSPVSIAIAPWPVVDEALRAPERARQCGLVIAAVSALRTLRGEANVPASKTIPQVIAYSDDRGVREILSSTAVLIAKLARVDALELRSVSTPRPSPAATTLAEGTELVVPLAGLIDIEEERGRIARALEKLDKEIAFVSRKLSNEKFVQNAKPEVVQAERDKLAAYQSDKARLQAGLERLG